jgi:hypothetical protein
METLMLYKTIVLELLKEQTQLHEQLRQTRQLLAAMNLCSKELKASHMLLQQIQTGQGSLSSQTANEALETAIEELRLRLPTALPPDGIFQLVPPENPTSHD